MKAFFWMVALLALDVEGWPSPSSPQENLQRITFFLNEDYTGPSETFTESNPDIQGTSPIGRIAKSFCVEKGVWLIFGNLSWSEERPVPPELDLDDKHGMLVSSNLGMICVSLHDEEAGQSAIYTRVRHLAGGDLEATSLSLFDVRMWNGNELFVSGDSIRLPSPLQVESFAFTGNVPWTVVSESEDSYCLPFGEAASDPFQFGLSFAALAEPILAVAASKGCREGIRALTDLSHAKILTKNFTLSIS